LIITLRNRRRFGRAFEDLRGKGSSLIGSILSSIGEVSAAHERFELTGPVNAALPGLLLYFLLLGEDSGRSVSGGARGAYFLRPKMTFFEGIL